MRAEKNSAWSRSTAYRVVFVMSACLIALSPLVFYWSKALRNPKEFKLQEKRYVTVDVRVRDISQAVLSQVKVGDIQKDYNWEESVRIEAVLKTEPQIAGRISLNGGGYADIVSGKRDLYLRLKMRYAKVGMDMLFYPGTTRLKVGRVLEIEFPNYVIYVEIINIELPRP
jgi:hypothetical protein